MMKRIIALFLMVLVFSLTGCGASQAASSTQTAPATTAETEKQNELDSTSEQAQPSLQKISENELQTGQETTDMIKLTVGNNNFLANLADNASANELRELLKNGPITMVASNYGGFEKVCSLGSRLTSNDVQTTTQAGDIMLYSSNQIVIFYGSNSWAYARLAKVMDEDIPNLKAVLSGDENEVIIELAK